MTQSIRIVIFDDDSADFVQRKVGPLVQDLGINCVFRKYKDEWLYYANEEAGELSPSLWLVDLYSKPDHNRGEEDAWEYIQGLGDDDPTLNQSLKSKELSKDQSQGLAVLLFAQKLALQKAGDATQTREQNRLVRVCSNFASGIAATPLVAYAATGDANAEFSRWGIDKEGLRDEADSERHQNALNGLKTALQELRELALPKPQVTEIPKQPQGVYAFLSFARRHLGVVLGLLVAAASAYFAFLQTIPRHPEFQDVQLGHTLHRNDTRTHCIVGKQCSEPEKFEDILAQGDSIDLQGETTDKAFFHVTEFPNEAPLKSDTEPWFHSKVPTRQFKRHLDLKRRSGLTFIVVLASNSSLQSADLIEFGRQLERVRMTKSTMPEGPGPFVCQGLTTRDTGGSLAIVHACEAVGEFTNQDPQNRQALLVAFSVKSGDSVQATSKQTLENQHDQH